MMNRLQMQRKVEKMEKMTHSYMESDRPRVVELTTCIHWNRLKHAGGLQNFSKLHSSLVTGLCAGSMALKVKVGKCFVCKRVDSYIHSCLHCIFFACVRSGHLRAHFKDTGHSIVCDLTTGSIYCFKCTDFIFDPDAVTLSRYNWRRVHQSRGISFDPIMNGVPFADRYLRYGGTPGTCLVPTATYGMRGLVNLGHTCFMNCIIQSLIHTPLLRDFFLSTKIDCKSEKHDSQQRKPCIITPLFELFQEFYNGSKTALSLHNLLPKIWDNAAHLAGYEQQDAHEFFIAILDALHLHFASNFAGMPCNCVVDITFLGRLQSAVTCTVCGHKSITVDPFWDTSLDIISDPSDTKRSIELEDVLRRYTRIEYLGPGSMIQCSDCGRKTESTKQLHFQVLPIILCLHLKRFEHSNTATCKKIDTCVRFPEKLDLSPFMANCGVINPAYYASLSASSSSSTSHHGHHHHGHHHHKSKRHRSSSSSHSVSAASSNVNHGISLLEKNANARRWYHLYAVVNHIGSFEGGHYYCYIKHGPNLWFKCDDHIITRVSREEVLNSPGYLLFYHKSVLPYDEAVSQVDLSID